MNSLRGRSFRLITFDKFLCEIDIEGQNSNGDCSGIASGTHQQRAPYARAKSCTVRRVSALFKMMCLQRVPTTSTGRVRHKTSHQHARLVTLTDQGSCHHRHSFPGSTRLPGILEQENDVRLFGEPFYAGLKVIATVP